MNAPRRIPTSRPAAKRGLNLERIPPQAVKAALLLAILVFASLAGVFSFAVARGLTFNSARAGGPGGPQITPGEVQSTPEPGSSGPARPNPNAPESQPTLTPWDGAGRVTVLLLGLDYRDWEDSKDYSRSDTMILMTLDPLTRTAGILSIPRDLWVPIPGFQHGKINTAYYLGEAYKLPGGGPGLAVKTVEQFLGVPINYYAQIDFDAFVRFIDEIGGVKVDVPEKIKIDLLGDNNTKTLKPGVQTLPGEWALAYARNRYTEGGDFDRARRQQQVIMGIRDRILSLDMLPTLISKAPVLYEQLSSGIHTNLQLQDAIKLALLAEEVRDEDIVRGVISQEQVIFGRSPDDLSILIPIPDKIYLLRDEVFATSGSLGPQTAGDELARMQAEAARLAVFNGSSDPGFGERTVQYLQGKGANVVANQAAGQAYANTTVIDHTGSPYTVQYLVNLLGIHPGRIIIDFDPNAQVDVELYLGDSSRGVEFP